MWGGLHALVLSSKAPSLAEVYPEGAHFSDEAALWPAIARAFTDHKDFLIEFMRSPPQTNEVGRSAVLFLGFQVIARETGLPLTTLELGASGGVNALWDHYAYDLGGAKWGPTDAPITLIPDWTGPVPPLSRLSVSKRAACDQNPIDPANEAARLRLRSYIWPDQLDRRHRFEAALNHFGDRGVQGR